MTANLSEANFDKVLLRKAQVIARCVKRAQEEFEKSQGLFLSDFSRQDAAVLNLQRACEAAKDMAQRVISQKGLSTTETTRGMFKLLQQHDVIDEAMATTLTHMVGFRNVAVHDYEDLDMVVVQSIIQKDIEDLLKFSEQMVKQFFKSEGSNK